MFSHFSHFSKFPVARSWRGFGLIELMVSVAIMLLVATILIVRQNSFNGTTLLQSQAYEIALAAREAQLNAVSASTIKNSTKEMRGLYFNTATPNTYRLFIDTDKDGFYDSGEEYGTTGSVDGRFAITSLETGGISRTELTVMFERPNYDARFYTAANTPVAATEAEIVVGIVDKPGVFRTVTVTPAGQISVQ